MVPADSDGFRVCVSRDSAESHELCASPSLPTVIVHGPGSRFEGNYPGALGGRGGGRTWFQIRGVLAAGGVLSLELACPYPHVVAVRETDDSESVSGRREGAGRMESARERGSVCVCVRERKRERE